MARLSPSSTQAPIPQQRVALGNALLALSVVTAFALAVAAAAHGARAAAAVLASLGGYLVVRMLWPCRPRDTADHYTLHIADGEDGYLSVRLEGPAGDEPFARLEADPSGARVTTPDGTEHYIPAARLRVEDVRAINEPGDRP